MKFGKNLGRAEFRATLFVGAVFFCSAVLAQAKTKNSATEPTHKAAAPSKTPLFKTQEATLAGQLLTLEIAETPEQQSHGLMFRTFLPKNRGMLFIYPSAQILGFWMKNTKIPLAIGFFDAEFRFIGSLEMTPADPNAPDHSLPRYFSPAPAMYALEMNSGWFKKAKVQPGALLELKTNTKP